ncbi:AAA family ATPase [Candidatus Woesearchaeota archaeon]|nr:AAA family ATPase [Candidatus Woesearchaeota archaeon]
MLIFIIGLPGSGKTTLGTILAQELNGVFFDIDDNIPSGIKQKISKGELLSLPEREYLLEDSINKIKKLVTENRTVVASLVIIKRKHHELLEQQFPDAVFFYLDAPLELLKQRISLRKHFCPLGYFLKMWETKEDLSIPMIDGTANVTEIIQRIKRSIELK